eukprot:CAMPEP_0184974932 /NCGR_PEP_ID=MMETSP1098-20130426/6291_1 /TAXON_ID=89044 /ORGANISM="Spumella elongata, Strain CCAP 955/1" /LENGTH=33 /DNA_ID= /DNA_START= /DNA_END= /DNA_ORIENTATION=
MSLTVSRTSSSEACSELRRNSALFRHEASKVHA